MLVHLTITFKTMSLSLDVLKQCYDSVTCDERRSKFKTFINI